MERLYFGYALNDTERQIIARKIDAVGRAVDLPRIPGRIETIRRAWADFVLTAWDYLPSRPLSNRIERYTILGCEHHEDGHPIDAFGFED